MLTATTADHLHAALRAIHDSEAISAETNATLASDREKIERIHHKVEAIDAEVEHSHYILRGMTSWFGNVFRRKPAPPAAQSGTARREHTEASLSVAATSARSSRTFPAGAAVGSHEGRDVPLGVRATEDALLDGLSQAIGRLHESAAASGSEIDRQGRVLDEHSAHADRSRARIDAATQKARDLAS